MTDPRFLDCSDLRSLLDDALDGTLDASERAAVEAHLVGCDACRAEEASLRALLAMAATLPREVAPGRDLWPGVAARLRPSSPSPLVVAFPRRLRPVALALAAVLLMTVGGALTHFLLEPGLAGPRLAGPTAASRPPASDVALAAARGDAVAGVELEVLRAKEALWRAAYRGGLELTPETLEVVEGSLRVLDEAIAELHAALAADPDNPHLTGLLVASHRREIALLERLSRPSEV